MPRLLTLCEYPTLLGGERSMLAVLPAVAAGGLDVEIAAPPIGPLADAVRAHGIPLAPWQPHDDHRVRRPLGELRDDLAELLTRHQPDLVHANSLSMARVSGPVVAAAHRPSVGHLRDIVKLSRRAVADLNRHRRLIAVSRATRDFHVAQGVDANKSAVVYNGVDLQAFGPRPATGYLHDELNLPAGSRLIATIGQLGMRKGTDVALAAARFVLAGFLDVHWLVVGQRTSDKTEAIEFERRLHAAAAEPTLDGHVHFLGTRDDVPRLLNECTLLVHAARQEPLGRVLLEAAACGLAVVATDAGGTREIFPTGADCAKLILVNDAYAMARAIVDLLRDDSRRESLGRAARRRAEAAFDVCDAAARLIDEYQALL